MKKLIILLGIALVAVVTPILGQATYQADPSNYLQIGEAIYQDGLPAITVSLTDVQDHLDGVVNAYPFDPSAIAPQLSVDEFSETNIKLSWIANPGADHYEIFYLNLNDGTSGLKLTNGNEVDIPNPSLGLYAFSIIEVSTYQVQLGQSLGNIIIQKDIMQFTVPNNNCDCYVDESVMPISFHVFQPADTYSENMSEMMDENESEEKFMLTIELEAAPGLERKVIFSKTPNGFEANCHDGFIVEDTYTGKAFVLDEYANGHFGAAVLTTKFDWQLHNFTQPTTLLSKAVIKKCYLVPPVRNNGIADYTAKAPLELLPNPATDLLQINSRSNKNGMLTITNQLGQVMYTKDLAFSHEEVQVKDWPQGVYYVNVRIKNEVFQETFVKVAY